VELRAPPRPAIFAALPVLSYLLEAPLQVAQGWRLVSWDGMDPTSLQQGHSGSLALPLPTSLPLLRSAAQATSAHATKARRLGHVTWRCLFP
jgi:hypothetical protein